MRFFIINLFLSTFLFLIYSSSAKKSLLFWNVACEGPQSRVRLEWNCEKVAAEESGGHSVVCKHGKDIVQELLSGERATLNVKQSVTGRYLNLEHFRLLFGNNSGDYTLLTFYAGRRNESLPQGCTVSYYAYERFEMFEDKLHEVLDSSDKPEAELQQKMDELLSTLRVQMKIDNRERSTELMGIGQENRKEIEGGKKYEESSNESSSNSEESKEDEEGEQVEKPAENWGTEQTISEQSQEGVEAGAAEAISTEAVSEASDQEHGENHGEEEPQTSPTDNAGVESVDAVTHTETEQDSGSATNSEQEQQIEENEQLVKETSQEEAQ